ncbi:VOC family protein [Psychroserpens luteolus]|uniref:VOC family protein n=1 Tax=Psychroserpens luteolus TaxID=2855840 RepID=UPI001E497B7E|nr:VOC family protein [Psychroserpens luteolus]MCD2260190.1 VOC family protein [Psychroserpens luteolus]
MKLTKNRYVLAVHDLEKSAKYYSEVLAFDVYNIDDPGWRFAERDNCMLMLGECKDAIPHSKLGDHAYFAYIEVEDIDLLYEEFASKGAQIRHTPEDKPWGMREFPLKTIDGHRITFGMVLDSNEKTERVG